MKGQYRCGQCGTTTYLVDDHFELSKRNRELAAENAALREHLTKIAEAADELDRRISVAHD